MMLNAMYLRNIIEQSIGHFIGYYQFKPVNSALVKAIAVLPDKALGDNYPPEETKIINGLEVVIHKPRLEISNRLSGDGIRRYKWEIFINQWHTSHLIEATNRLIEKLHDERIETIPAVYSNINPGKANSSVISYSRIAIIEKEFKRAIEPEL